MVYWNYIALFTMPLLMLCGCTSIKQEGTIYSTEDLTEDNDNGYITLDVAVYDVGGLGDPQALSPLLTKFYNEYPDININVLYLDYDTGDSIIEERIATGNPPDIVFEGPERLVADWGKRSLMMNISDMLPDDIQENVINACYNNDEAYIYPVCMTAHCMGINREIFEETDCLKYLDENTRMWSTDQFSEAIYELYNNGYDVCFEIYCNNQAGDQGTRALVNNLYNGTFTNHEHTSYTVDSKENIEALELLTTLPGVSFNRGISGVEAVNHFISGEVPVVLCWNVSMESSKTLSGELNFDVLPMNFPVNDGLPSLTGGVWGFGIFDSDDNKRVEASKTFIKYMTEGKQYESLVLKTSFWPTRKISNIYVNDELMIEYKLFTDYIGDYYQVTDNWASARKAWWQLLQKVGEGENIAKSCEWFQEQVE